MTTPDLDRTMRVDSDGAYVTPHSTPGDVQFAPGTLIAGRYRIAGILGKGGMGEVYRADDVKLGQQVALKFLPARLARDPMLLARLHDEVRLGRQVAHPNVCRIYDIGEFEGAHFVAMEYVDGEDLARLLHRIGRLAHDKAVDIARGIAAGLMAAHAKGIVHRDLKPANVMIDSQGDARITDFGLALSAGADQEGVISGTPAYMAPEQLQGDPATVQSDLYALGLVMYELFTGRRAHTARTLPERVRDVSSEITIPSAHIRDIDPAVEKVILRCLNNDPMQRPRSARQVIEALPGGDPLAAALAAGETPSPRIVAAAGSAGVLSRTVAWSLLGAVIVMLAMCAWAWKAASMANYGPMLAPEVLHERAESLLRTFGVPAEGTPVESFEKDGDYLAWLYKRGQGWEALRNGPPWLSYRLEYGPTPQISRLTSGETLAPGWTTIAVDAKGRLAFLLAAPKRDWAPSTLDWNALLVSAGLDPKSLRPADARMIPSAPFDTLRAWSGTYPNDAVPVRVEAAAWRGRPVYFRVAGPWNDIDDPTAGVPFLSRSVATGVAALLTAIAVAGILLGLRNLRARRGDRQGALRVALLMFTFSAVGGLLAYPLGSGMGALDMASIRISEALFAGALAYLMYVALEPYVRRRWPGVIIGWTRFISGNVRDPMVGRDVLVGVAGGMLHAAIAIFLEALTDTLAGRATMPLTNGSRRLNGVLQAIGAVTTSYGSSLVFAFIVVVLLVILAIVLRRRGLAVAALALVFAVVYYFAVGRSLLLLLLPLAVVAVELFILVRYGLLAVVAMQGTFVALNAAPAAMGAAWALPVMVVPLVVILALAAWAFHTALGGQSPWPALDE